MRIFCVDATFNGMPKPHDVRLDPRQVFTCSDANLHFNDVYTSNPLSHRMLNLYTSIHLDKIELAVLEQEFERASPP